jgi:hypothetical protein
VSRRLDDLDLVGGAVLAVTLHGADVVSTGLGQRELLEPGLEIGAEGRVALVLGTLLWAFGRFALGAPLGAFGGFAALLRGVVVAPGRA